MLGEESPRLCLARQQRGGRSGKESRNCCCSNIRTLMLQFFLLVTLLQQNAADPACEPCSRLHSFAVRGFSPSSHLFACCERPGHETDMSAQVAHVREGSRAGQDRSHKLQQRRVSKEDDVFPNASGGEERPARLVEAVAGD
eukprot:747107-Hanusia_phi.AAC.1